ncbi:unnamed protein product, partial [Rotaria sp. Silwood1]
MTSTDCDTNSLVRSWAGERYDTITLPLTTSITIGIINYFAKLDVTVTERVIAQSFCSGATITNYVTSSPIGMQHSAVVSQGGGLYVMTLTWTPEDNQYGPQGFCAGAVDSNNLQSDAWCITYLVGFDSPDLIRTAAVQGTASPIGTIFSNHSVFSIQ